MFGLGNTFGVSLGTLLLTAAFRYYSGDATATPTPANAMVFVQSDEFQFFHRRHHGCDSDGLLGDEREALSGDAVDMTPDEG